MRIVQALFVSLLLCMSTSALAKGGVKDQVLITPPLAGGKFYQVIYLNKSGQQLDIAVEFFDFNGDSLEAPTVWSPNNGGSSWVGFTVNYNSTSAHVTWFGRPDDLLVTVCSLDDFSINTIWKACVNAN